MHAFKALLPAVVGLSLCLAAFGQAAKTASAPAGKSDYPPDVTTMPSGPEVTITGSFMCDWATMPKISPGSDKSDGPEHSRYVIYALDGSAAIKAEVDKVMEDFFPDKGLNADAAQKLLDQWTGRLKYYVARGTPAGDAIYARRHGEGSAGYTLTGVTFEKDGKKFIAVSKATEIIPQDFAKFFPKKMKAADKPFEMPDKDPLILKVSDDLSIKCLKLPAGKYMEGSYFFMHQRFVEEYPHMVTLTKPFYLAECAVTQEVWEAVMGSNPSAHKNPKLPVENPQIQDINKFCEKLSEKTGKKVRLPKDAEWEYASRVGTSNPPLVEKYEKQYCGLPGRMVAEVKSKEPNAWGIYDMASAWWEVVADAGFYNPRTSQTDQFFPPNDATGRSQHRGRGLWAYNHSGACVEFIPGNPDSKNSYVSQTFRVAVDAEVSTATTTAKAADK